MVEASKSFLYDHIFISYARADAAPFAERLHDDLEATGISAWLDTRDIRDGFDWDAEIDRGLRAARAVVAVLTPASVLSLQAKSEWNDALNRYTPVIGLLVKTCEIPRVLRMLNYIDCRQDYDSGLAHLRKRLNRLEDEHLAYLKELLAGYEAAQKQDNTPDRYAYKIQALREVVGSWDQRKQIEANQITDHEDRIIEGIKSEHERLVLEAIERNKPESRKVVGQKFADITNFKDREWEREQIASLTIWPRKNCLHAQ